MESRVAPRCKAGWHPKGGPGCLMNACRVAFALCAAAAAAAAGQMASGGRAGCHPEGVPGETCFIFCNTKTLEQVSRECFVVINNHLNVGISLGCSKSALSILQKVHFETLEPALGASPLWIPFLAFVRWLRKCPLDIPESFFRNTWAGIRHHFLLEAVNGKFK